MSWNQPLKDGFDWAHNKLRRTRFGVVIEFATWLVTQDRETRVWVDRKFRQFKEVINATT